MSGGLPIARLFGIEVRVSFAWAFLLAVVTFIGSQQAAATSPGLGVPLHWLIGVLVALGFLVTVVAHELAHALVGRRVRGPDHHHHAGVHRGPGATVHRGVPPP